MIAINTSDDWAKDAACLIREPDRSTRNERIKTEIDPVFFVERGGSNRHAKKTCATCPVQIKCLETALANNEEHGVFGGLDPHERRALQDAAAS